MVFETAPKVAKHLRYLGDKISYQEIQKIAQSGHTVLCASTLGFLRI